MKFYTLYDLCKSVCCSFKLKVRDFYVDLNFTWKFDLPMNIIFLVFWHNCPYPLHTTGPYYDQPPSPSTHPHAMSRANLQCRGNYKIRFFFFNQYSLFLLLYSILFLLSGIVYMHLNKRCFRGVEDGLKHPIVVNLPTVHPMLPQEYMKQGVVNYKMDIKFKDFKISFRALNK